MYNVPSKARKYLPGKQCDNHPIICPMRENNHLRWLDIVFQGQYLPRLSVIKLCRHKQRFGKIDTTVVLDKDENLL